jgi:hypothetical protein
MRLTSTWSSCLLRELSNALVDSMIYYLYVYSPPFKRLYIVLWLGEVRPHIEIKMSITMHISAFSISFSDNKW